MLLRFFKSGLPSRTLALLFILFILQFSGLTQTPHPVTVPDNIFLPWFFSFQPESNLFRRVISFLILAFTGYFINYLATVSGITGKRSSLTFFFFILFCSLFPFYEPLNPYLFATLLMAWYFSQLFKISETTNTIRFAFDAGLILGTASLFFPILIYLSLFTWIALLIYQTTKWRNFIVSLLGSLIPYLILYGFSFNPERQNTIYRDFIPGLTNIFSFHDWHPVQLAAIAFFTFVVLYASLQVLSTVRNKNIEVRRQSKVVFWSLIFMFFLVVLFQSQPEAFVPLSIPASWLMASFFENAKDTKRAGWVVNGLFLTVVFFQVYFFYAA